MSIAKSAIDKPIVFWDFSTLGSVFLDLYPTGVGFLLDL